MKKLLLAFLFGVWLGGVSADARKPGASTVALKFPCTAKAVTRIWVDDEIFWDGEQTGLMMLKTCDTLELHILWYESVVVEYLNQDEQGRVSMFRAKLYVDGRLVPMLSIPEFKELKV